MSASRAIMRISCECPQLALSGRHAPPPHHSFKIQSFSLLSKAPIDKVSSDKFESGDGKWKLIIYPNGDKSRNGEDHISIFLALVDTSSRPAGWQLSVIFNLFVYNHLSDEYFSFKDGISTRFHAMKTEWGFPRFMPLSAFADSSNGFIMDDACIFGAEVFVLEQTRKGECLSMIKEPVTASYTWRIKNYSSLINDRYESELFTGADYRWKIRLFPGGNGEGKGNSVSLFLCVDESTLPPDTRLFVKFTLRILNQDKRDDHELEADNMFGPSCLAWGAQKMISQAKFKDSKMGFLMDNCCAIEAELTLLGVVTSI